MKYCAYGSNLLTRRLRYPSRAPSAVALGIVLAPGCVMRFHKIGTDGCGKCTLIATGDDADLVYGVLYEFADADVAGGDTTDPMTYIAGDRCLDAACVPFDWYRDLVVAGAGEHRLPSAYVEELARTPAVPDPDVTRAARARRLLEEGWR